MRKDKACQNDDAADWVSGYMAEHCAIRLSDFLREIACIRGKSLLDIGCGGGRTFAGMAAVSSVALGIEVRPSLALAARLMTENYVVENTAAVWCADWEAPRTSELALAAYGGFDVVTCLFTAMYFERPVLAIEDMVRVANPGGKLVFASLGQGDRAEMMSLHEQAVGVSSEIDSEAYNDLRGIGVTSRLGVVEWHRLRNRVWFDDADLFADYYERTITCQEAMEHVPRAAELFRQAAREKYGENEVVMSRVVEIAIVRP